MCSNSVAGILGEVQIRHTRIWINLELARRTTIRFEEIVDRYSRCIGVSVTTRNDIERDGRELDKLLASGDWRCKAPRAVISPLKVSINYNHQQMSQTEGCNRRNAYQNKTARNIWINRTDVNTIRSGRNKPFNICIRKCEVIMPDKSVH